MTRYEQDLRGGDFKAAWALLAVEQQKRSGSYEAFARDEAATLGTGLYTKFAIQGTDADRMVVERWIVDVKIATSDPGRAVVVTVDYPALTDNSGWSAYLVGPDTDGALRIWLLR